MNGSVRCLMAFGVLVAAGLVVAGPAPPSAAGAPTAAGVFTFYDLPDGVTAHDLEFAPDGTLWFINGTEFFADSIVEYDTEDQVVVQDHAIDDANVADIAVGPTGRVWFADTDPSAPGGSGYLDGGIVRFRNPFNTVTTEPIEADVVTAHASGAVFGRHDSSVIWDSPMTNPTTDDYITMRPHLAMAMTMHPNGDAWLQVQINGESPTRLAHFTPGVDTEVTKLTESSVYSFGPGDITSGPGGNLFYTLGVNGIFRIAPTATHMDQDHWFVNAGGGDLAYDGEDVWSAGGTRLGRLTAQGVASYFGHPRLTAATSLAIHPETDDIWIANGDELAHFVPTPKRTCDGRGVTVDLNYPSSRQTRSGIITDVILGTSGSDTVRAEWGVDIVCGGNGNDRIIDQDPWNLSAVDRFFGQNGNDMLTGAYGNELLDGGPGTDTIRAGYGNDRLLGGPQRDTCDGGNGTDSHSGCEVRSRIP